MANEITVTTKLSLSKGSYTTTLFANNGVTFDITGTKFLHNVQSIGSSEEAIDLGDLTAGGFFIAVNRDTAKTINIRRATGEGNFAELRPGESCLVRLEASMAPFAIATVSSADLEYLMLED